MLVRDMIREFGELTPDAKLRYVRNLGNGWAIKTSNEFVLVRDPGAGPAKAGWEEEMAKYIARLKAEP